MIQLNNDCLLFQTSKGESIPCSAEVLAIEMMGDAAAHLDPEVIRQAAAAVLHYFRHDLGRDSVTVADFSMMLERVLTSLGVKITANESPDLNVAEVFDLRQLAPGFGQVFELAFFPQLRDELRKKLTDSPQLLRCHGLRDCVKQILGVKRWSHRCQDLNDQIVDYMRQCLITEEPSQTRGLVIR